jgi:hypothetical protein
MAWMRFRQGNFIALADDEDDEPAVEENRYEYY